MTPEMHEVLGALQTIVDHQDGLLTHEGTVTLTEERIKELKAAQEEWHRILDTTKSCFEELAEYWLQGELEESERESRYAAWEDSDGAVRF